jgi:type VI secretion system protein ImpL
MRERLGAHLDALLAEPLPAVALDGALLQRARDGFALVSPAARVYARIRGSVATAGLPPWRPRDALGVLGATLFMRSSGRGLDEGVPGLFTAAGFYGVLLPSVGPAIRLAASESWVLGARSPLAENPAAAVQLEQAVIGLYAADFVRAWEQMLADLQVVPLRSVSQAAQDLYILASPQSPIRTLLAAIVQQVALTDPGAPVRSRLDSSLGSGGFGPNTVIAGHFRPLREFVGDGPGAPLDQALRSLTEPQQSLARMAQAAAAPAATGADPTAVLRADLSRWPAPAARWLRSIADGVTALRQAPGR